MAEDNSMIDKGIYFSFHAYLTGEVNELFKKRIEDEIRVWLDSDLGKQTIRNTVNKCIREAIDRRFPVYNSEDYGYKKFTNIIKDAVMKELLGAVGANDTNT